MPKTNPFDAPRADWLRSIIEDGYRTDSERTAAAVLLKMLPADLPKEIPLTIPMKFYVGQRIVHQKSGGVYAVVGLPNVWRVEHTGEPAYAYMANGVVWVRGQSEMEDGRFVAHVDTSPVEVGRYGGGRFGLEHDTEADLFHGAGSASALLDQAG